MSLAVPKPRRWLAPVLRPHRQRVWEFRVEVLEREEDHRSERFRLSRPSDLRRDQMVFVVKEERDVGLIYVPRKVRAVYPWLGGRFMVHLRGGIPPDFLAFQPWATIRTAVRR
jgi:hypothetical protein